MKNDKKRILNTPMSSAALILTFAQIAAILLMIYTEIDYLVKVPYIFASLVLALISKNKYDDKMSSTIIIVDLVFIGLTVMALGFLIIAILAGLHF